MWGYDCEVFGNYRRVLAAFGELQAQRIGLDICRGRRSLIEIALMEGVSEFREELHGYTASIQPLPTTSYM